MEKRKKKQTVMVQVVGIVLGPDIEVLVAMKYYCGNENLNIRPKVIGA